MSEFVEREPTEFGEKYAALRIVNPRAETAMEKSLRTYGQLTPVVCARSANGYELIDGFKRLRASRRLKMETLTARILVTSERVSKAAMIQLNKASRSLSAIEEAFVVHALHEEDGLNQLEIGMLVGRHVSWVSRRLSLVRNLEEPVQQTIKLGLLSVVAGRDVARLPRGKQSEAMEAILKHGLSTREVSKLVTYLLQRPRWEHAVILASPWELFENPPKRSDLKGQLLGLRKLCRAVSERVRGAPPEEILLLHDAIDLAAASAKQVASDLKRARGERG